MKWLVSAALLLVPAQNDPAAKALYAAMRDRIVRAATVQAEFSVTLVRDGQEFGSLRGQLRAKDRNRWILEQTLIRRDLGEEESRPMFVQSDGRRVRLLHGAPEGMSDLLKAHSADFLMRLSCVDSPLPLLAFADPRLLDYDPERPPIIQSHKSGPREKLGGREGEVLECVLRVHGKASPPRDAALKIWVDPESKLPFRRTLSLDGMEWSESIFVTLDGDLPDGDFVLQTRQGLARAQAGQLAESIRLFSLYTGRPPDSLEDLRRKPADLDADIFWPRGGFILGAVPRDPWGRPFELVVRRGRRWLVSLGEDGLEGGSGEKEDIEAVLVPATGSAVGAPTERLAKYFNARIELFLLSAAVTAYRETYSELPRQERELREVEPWMTVRHEGGWIPADRILKDPWDNTYRMVFGDRQVRAAIDDPAAGIKAENLTDEERRRLEETGRPRIRPADRAVVAALLDRLGDDDFAAREKAQAELKARGSAILSMIEDRLKTETDAEIIYRLQGMRKGLPKPTAAWTSEFGPLRFVVLAEDVQPRDIVANEHHAAAILRVLARAEADFRSNDRDANGVHDFWTGDVAGLYFHVPDGDRLIHLRLAAADASPLPGRELPKAAPKAPWRGYWYRALRKDNSANPPEEYQLEPVRKGGPRALNRNRFGFVGYPAEYAVTGTRTFIINESMSVFWKDTQGEPVDEWPDDAALQREWALVK